MKKTHPLPYKLRPGLHYVLTNIKTGNVSSSSNWLTAMAAVAVLTGDNIGLPSLLPQAKAKRLLAMNTLDIRVQRGVGSRKLSTALARKQAKAIIPKLALLWQKEKPLRTPRRGDFCEWIVKSLRDPKSQAHRIAVGCGCHEILDRANSRWWLARLEKMQS